VISKINTVNKSPSLSIKSIQRGDVAQGKYRVQALFTWLYRLNVNSTHNQQLKQPEEKSMKLNEEQIAELSSHLSGWRREGDWLVRDYKLENFKSVMEFVNRVADEAEAMDHHPDIHIHGWNNVRLSVMTHSVGGLTEKDFKLAVRINRMGS